MTAAMLEIAGLESGYGASAVLHGVDLAVDRGEVMAIMGRNGMGKTTLLRTCMGLLPARVGAIRFAGEDISGLPPHRIARRGLAYVPQGREVFADFTVADNLRLGRLGAGQRASGAIPDRLFDWFPVLAGRLRQKAGTLSGGEQQMLAIARALAVDPTMLLLDEPTEGIQPSVVHQIAVILGRIAAETGVTVLVVEQNVDLVLTLAQRCGFMDEGRIVETCPVAAIRADERVLARHLSL
jgi:urea ABC transporter ATP-binding protein UrtE